MKSWFSKNSKKKLAWMLTCVLTLSVLVPTSMLSAKAAVGEVKLIDGTAAGWLESAYAEWSIDSEADGYKAYIKKADEDDSKYSAIDNELIRKYKDYYRVDAVGLAAGNYVIKVVPVKDGKELPSKAAVTDSLNVKAHDRSGFAWVNGTASGAYNEDGTLKSNAIVVYVTEENKDTVTVKLNKEGKGEVDCTGVQNIILAYKKGKETRPISIRFIGNITDPAVLTKGDLYLDTVTAGMTVEGIGQDTVFNGFGLVMKNCSNVEVRNIGYMNCNSEEGDDVGLQQDNDHIWVHNCDFFYGDAGSDADQVKGDGALDTKKSQYVTHSYNHFWDNGKTHLNGNKDTKVNYISYHHNWYDHSDSRHPLVRVSSAIHVYNNFYDGVAKYGMISRMGASIFSEGNYFLNSHKPMLISQQGTDMAQGSANAISSEDGGMIKSFNNVYVGTSNIPVTHKDSSTDFDCYEAESRTENVPDTYKTVKGGNTYSNFDTASTMYSYTVQTAEEAKETVKQYSGRVAGGDFKWNFTDEDNDSYAVNQALKDALVNYKSSLVSVGGINGTDVTPEQTTKASETETTKAEESTTKSDSTTKEETTSQGETKADTSSTHTFVAGESDSYFTVGGSTANKTASYDNKRYTKCVKLDSKGSLTFTTETDNATLSMLVSAKKTGSIINVNGTNTFKDLGTDVEYVTTTLGKAGTYKVSQGKNECYIFMAVVTENKSSEVTTKAEETTKATEATTKAEETTKATEATTKAEETTKATEATTKAEETTKATEATTKAEETTKATEATTKATEAPTGVADIKKDENNNSVANVVASEVDINDIKDEQGNKVNYEDLDNDAKQAINQKMNFAVKAPENVIPDDTKLVISKVVAGKQYEEAKQAVKEQVNKIAVFNIDLIKNDVKVQPSGSLEITTDIPNGYDVNLIAVYRIGDDGSYTKLNSNIVNGKIVFETNHFSTYVIAEENKDVVNTPAVTPSDVSTGDAHSIYMFILIMVMAGFTAVILMKRKRA
ncbi:MAG: hypothetical protein MR675_00055 [Lachnospira sp.]|nr:hypothetical protein [Lachnospira sp.]